MSPAFAKGGGQQINKKGLSVLLLYLLRGLLHTDGRTDKIIPILAVRLDFFILQRGSNLHPTDDHLRLQAHQEQWSNPLCRAPDNF